MRNRIKYRFAWLIVPFLLLGASNINAQVYINEIMASNATTHADADFGNYVDWIEIYNGLTVDFNLGNFFLTDDPANMNMWQFPSGTILKAGEYLLVYADGIGYGLHTNFNLDKAGEIVMLTNGASQVIDSLRFAYQLTDISYGRESADPGEVGFFTSPSPETANSNNSIAGFAPSPGYSLDPGFYAGPQSIGLSSSMAGVKYYYTLDGTEPDEGSTLYTAPIPISSTTVLRVRGYKTGLLPGLLSTHSFFIDEPQNLPVISLVTDPDHFFSDETGIYVIGTNGVPGYCTDVPHNVNQDWERPVNLELIEKDGTIGINQVVGAKIFGGCSRVRYPIKSLGFYARKEYETASFRYKLFPGRENEDYETFILRASADDQPFTLFRDALGQMVVKDEINVDVQDYRPVVLYINGEYWGIHNMREKINEHYANDNFGVNSDSVSMLRRDPRTTYNWLAGSGDHYNAMYDFVASNDISVPANYEYVSTQMDIDEYINYQIIQIFFGDRDWPGNNIKFWRSEEPPYNRWRWVLYDLDQYFKETFSNIMEEATEIDCGCDWPNPPWSTLLFRKLLENDEFKHAFIQRFSIYSSTVFSRERIHRIINEMEAVLEPEIPRHVARWGGQKTNLPDNTWVSPIFSSPEQWKANVQVMRDFSDARHEIALKHVHDYFGISGMAGLEAAVLPGDGGKLVFGAIQLKDSVFSGDITLGESLDISCIPEDGFTFSHWEIEELAVKDTALIKRGDHWKYFVAASQPDDNWRELAFDDAAWPSGDAQLGYGDGDEATVIAYGGNSSNKYITTAFRKVFAIEDTAEIKRYTIHLLRDDGARVFVNGTEVIRDNMQRWSYGYSSTAEFSIDGAAESAYHTFYINPGLFRNGDNIVAVEIHQSSNTSSDISFDLELLARGTETGSKVESTDRQIQLVMEGEKRIKAVFINDTISYDGLFINEIMTLNLDKYQDEAGEYEDWIEIYNGSGRALDLGGLFLADTVPAVKNWRIPKGAPEITTIQPGDFLVVFADQQAEQGLLHADFRLSGLGEEVALLRIVGNDTSMIDHVVFGAQYGNVSWGRYPDGSTTWQYMPVITPWEANFWEPLDNKDVERVLQEEAILVYPQPTDGQLFIRFEFATDHKIALKVYSMTGNLVISKEYPSSSLVELSLADQAAGLYLLRIDMNGTFYERRVIKY